ncbi:hypothetical protein ISS08_01540 [Candidatus Pacearchaeota archaeon]|nr:hypothetical protein [Candidatus Pacearchaeota archaeon]
MKTLESDGQKIGILNRPIHYRTSDTNSIELAKGDRGILAEHDSPSHFNVYFGGITGPAIKVRKQYFNLFERVVVKYDEAYVSSIHEDDLDETATCMVW